MRYNNEISLQLDEARSEEDEKVLTVTVYCSLLENADKLLPGFNIQSTQTTTPRKENRKGLCYAVIFNPRAVHSWPQSDLFISS